jgi:arylformamidase
MQPIQGHAAITQFWRAAITRATAAGAQRTIRLHESHTSGDLGYALCTVTVQIPASSNAAAANIAVWDATIWRRDPGGTWRIAVDISTPLPRLRSRTEPSVTEYRASLDAAVSFSNGGDLTVHGFRIDVPSPDVGEAEIAALFTASLGLLMTDSVQLSNVHVFAEPHKGTRGGPADHRTVSAATTGRLVELSHVIRAGMTTYPGLPAPAITPHLTRQASREHYAPGTEFAIDQLTLVGNTGTYLDAPYHRYAGGADLSAISLEQTVDLPAVIVRMTGARQLGIDVGALAALDVRGAAVLLHTGDDARFGAPAYSENEHFLTRAGAIWLVDHGAALVGIDALNIDDTADAERPAHSLLLAAGIPVVEHLTGLGQLPPTGARFTAVPLRIEATGTIPVRAFARLPE